MQHMAVGETCTYKKLLWPTGDSVSICFKSYLGISKLILRTMAQLKGPRCGSGCAWRCAGNRGINAESPHVC